MVIATLAACASAPVPEKTLVAVSIAAVTNLNPTPDGRPSPLLVRIYQLRDTAKFNAAGFFALYENDDQTLAGELAGREELVVQPGQSVNIDLGDVAEGVRYVGVFAAYRDLGQAVWRKSIDIPRGRSTKIAVSLSVNGLAVQSTRTASVAPPIAEKKPASWSLSDSWNKVLDSLKPQQY
jgi:type VI secretion system protein VasD